MKMSKVLNTAILAMMVLIWGCGKSNVKPVEDTSKLEVRTPTPEINPFEMGKSVNGEPMIVKVIGDGSDVVFILAAIHGDAATGTLLIKELETYLDKNQDIVKGKKVVLLPAANPDGVKTGSHLNQQNVDINRNFMTDNRKDSEQYGMTALSEPETRAIVKVINDYKPARIINIHEGAQCIDYDGPAKDLAKHIGKNCKLQVKKIGARPGSLGSYAGETLKIPTITFALHRDISKKTEKLWERYGNALLAAITFGDEQKEEEESAKPSKIREERKSKDQKQKNKDRKSKTKIEAKAKEEAEGTDPKEEAKRNFEHQMQEAIITYTQGSYSDAKQKFEALLRTDKNCEECREYIAKCRQAYLGQHYSSGVRYFENGKIDDAIREWRKVEEMNPNYESVKQNIESALKLKESQKKSQ